MSSLLIVEDDLTFATMLKKWLQKRGFDVETAGALSSACAKLKENDFDIILSDLCLPDGDGLSLLDKTKEHHIPFIVMTSYADVPNAVKAMKLGACDYIAKPVQPDILLEKISDALAKRGKDDASKPKEQIVPTPSASSEAHDEDYTARFMEGRSEAARQLYNYVALVAPTPMSVLINGASGTGKEYVAHRIHQLSKRADKPFVAIDCGAMQKDLAASEFFGHIKGAFTGAVSDKTGAFVEANGGTLFLDEVGNLSYDVQVQLLRAIQERRIRPVGASHEIEVDVRLVSATNEDLASAISRGEFREDLFHRLNEFTLHMPDLKDRGEDILLFADFFLCQANEELERNVKGFDAAASEAMMTYSWPGNLRQLKNLVKRAALLARKDIITLADFGEEFCKSVSTPANDEPIVLRDVFEEKDKIVKALQSTNGNKSKAALLLGIDRKTLYNKMKQYGIPQ